MILRISGVTSSACVPVLLEPLLQHRHRRAGDLHVEFDVLGQPRHRQVRRPDQRRGADDLEPRVSDVSLGVKLVLGIRPTLDLP